MTSPDGIAALWASGVELPVAILATPTTRPATVIARSPDHVLCTAKFVSFSLEDQFHRVHDRAEDVQLSFTAIMASSLLVLTSRSAETRRSIRRTLELSRYWNGRSSVKNLTALSGALGWADSS